MKYYALKSKNKGRIKYYWLRPAKGASHIKGLRTTFKPVHWVYSKDQLDAILKFAENTIKMLYVFLSLFASQLLLASPFMIRKEQSESGPVNTVSSEISKTAQQSTDPKAHPFPIIEGPKAAGSGTLSSKM